MGLGGRNVTVKVIHLTVIGMLIVLYSGALDKMSLGENEGKGDLLFCSSWAHVYGVFIVIHTFMHINLFELYLIDVCAIS